MSLLLDPKVQHWENSLTAIPSTSAPFYLDTIAALKDSLKLSEEKFREIGVYARKQRESNQ